MTADSRAPLTLAEVPEWRRKSEAVADILKQQIVAHLETLRPVFAAERVFGKLAGGRLEIPGSDRALTEIQESFRTFAAPPFNLSDPFEASWLPLVSSALDVHPYEYTHTVGGKIITIASPLRWVINYRTHYSPAQVRNILAGKEPARADYLRLHVVNALVLRAVTERSPGLARLFADLRFDLRTEKSEALRGLPITTISAQLPTFRPPDDILAAAMAFSGVAAFIELIDFHEARILPDPLREKLAAFLG